MMDSLDTEKVRSIARDIVRTTAEHTDHIWVREQLTGHRVCAWCNACDDAGCGRTGNLPKQRCLR